MINYGLSLLKYNVDHKTQIQEEFYPSQIERKYNKNSILIGKNVYTNEDIMLDLGTKNEERRANHFIITGSTGSGKSWLIQDIISRAVKSNGHLACFPTDVKPEHYLLNRPLQQKYHKFLAKNEVASGLKTKMFYPFFMTKITNHIPKDCELIQLSFHQLNVTDFLSLINYERLTPMQQTVIPQQFDEAKRQGVNSFDSFMQFIENNKEIQPATYRIIKMTIQNLIEHGILGDKYSDFSFSAEINQGIIPTLNLYGWNMLGQNVKLAAAFVSVILREITNAKLSSVIDKHKKVWIIIDEAGRFVPRDANVTHPSRFQCIEMTHLIRQAGGIMGFAVQNITQLPVEIINQCKYIFIPQNIQFQEMYNIFKEVGFYTSRYNFAEFVANKLKMLRNTRGKHNWMLIDVRGAGNYRTAFTNMIFTPFAPLGYHKDE